MSAGDLGLALVGIAVALALVMAMAALVERRTRNAGFIDTFWTFGVGLVGAAGALLPLGSGHGVGTRQALVGALALLWALRLGTHILRRTLRIADDPRYAKLKQGWGADAPRQMFALAQKQAVVSIPLVLAIWLAAHNPHPGLQAQDFFGAALLAVAILGEGLADRQLRRFAAYPPNKGRICVAGLWAWSRHPNYFFEWLGWLAYPVIAIDLSGAYPAGLLALAAPACMYWLLVYVSGVPPLEEHMLATRGDAFRAYQERTSAFFPLRRRAARAAGLRA